MKSRKLPVALTIAGTDPSGGAGIQADLKTFSAFGVYGESCITAVTAQNTCGVTKVQPMGAEMVQAQLQAVFSDIVPDAVKIGMVGTAENILAVSDALRMAQVKASVLDPVMLSTSGTRLLDTSAQTVLIDTLLPQVQLVTPNIPEAEALTGCRIAGKEDIRRAAARLAEKTGTAVLLKGGHLPDTSDDFLLCAEGEFWLCAQKVDNPHTHGTGCTLSSAITAGLATGASLHQAVCDAKAYLTRALEWGLALGKGCGPLNHMVPNK